MDHPRSIPDRTEAENQKWLTAAGLRRVPGLVHGFTLRAAGDATDPAFAAELCAATGMERLRRLRQVHGRRVVAARDPAAQPEGDGWAGRPEPGVLLGILTADCLPVLLCHPRSGVLGLAHAGWRGAAAGVVGQVLEAMEVPADEVWAALGPAIGSCCYQVGSDVVRALPPGSPRLAPWPGRPDRFRFDLAGLVRDELLSRGVRGARIDASGLCTACDPDRFFSYRREDATGRLCAFLGWRPEGGR